jgi:hypothetical protein
VTSSEPYQEDPSERTSAPWRRPEQFGYSETLRGLGGIVAPLLTGFSLTAITLLLTASSKPWLADWAAVALTITVACLLFSMQLAFLALALNPSPADILTWMPEVTISADALLKAREEQAANLEEVKRLWRRTGIAYDVGIVAFLVGLVLLSVPHSCSPSRILATAVATMALSGELWWVLANHIDRLPHPVIRESKRVSFKGKLAQLDAVGRAAVLDPARKRSADEDSDGGE